MFQNVLMTTLAPVSDTNKVRYWDNRPFTTIWPEIKEEKLKDTSLKKTIKKKKRNRTMFTTEQVRVLEKIFTRSKYIDVDRRREISECLQIEQKCIKIWFQNRRMKEKKELSEYCDSMSESQTSYLESISPPLESTKSSNKKSDKSYIHPLVNSCERPSHYYYDAPNNYNEEDALQNVQPSYEMYTNHSIPQYLNYNVNNFYSNEMRTNTDCLNQYCPPQTEFQCYYGTGEVNSHTIGSNIREIPANIYDTSYF